MQKLTPLLLKNVILNDPFWNRSISLLREKVIPYQWDVLNDHIPQAEKSHCIKNFEIAAGICEGEFYGMVFQDSDLYKWLESVSFSLATKPDPKLMELADRMILLIGKAQQPDGYINTYYTVKKPGKRFTNLQQGHELYCAGHLIEAATAHFYATGKRDFLDIACRFADCIDHTFGVEDDKLHGYPGHQEIELALIKLYRATKENKYLRLAEYFIARRGKTPDYFAIEKEKPGYEDVFVGMNDLGNSYNQSHLPPVEQTKACGHAVRAVYMYSAMADLAAELDDPALANACNALYENITQRQMYSTGGIGATAVGESFTSDYDLPNDTVYAETCASIGLMMFCQRMNLLHQDAKYIDTLERALYNTVLAGISLSGTEFFYVNPLAVDPATCATNPNYKHVKPVRQKWFACSCCPPNLTRTVMSLGSYAFSTDEKSLYINLYLSACATFSIKDQECGVDVKTNYPYGNEAVITATRGAFGVCLRSPASSGILSLQINGVNQAISVVKGYIHVDKIEQGDEIRIVFAMKPKLTYCHEKVHANIGKVAVERGPLVYCMEQVDNGSGLDGITISQHSVFSECPPPIQLPPETVALEVTACRYVYPPQTSLYAENPPMVNDHFSLKLIPYFLWANRGENEMTVYITMSAK